MRSNGVFSDPNGPLFYAACVSKQAPLPAPPRVDPKRSDSKAIVEAILTAARELVASGTEGVSFRAVAERAGVGEASVHRYFPTKLALFTAVFAAQHQNILDTLRAVLDQASSLEEGIEGCVRFFAGFDEQELAVRRSLNSELPLTWTLDRLVEAIDATRDVFAAWLRQQMPDISASEAEHRVFYVVASVRGAVTLRMLQPDRAPATEAMVAVLERHVLEIAQGLSHRT